jgi:quinolinate synthase
MVLWDGACMVHEIFSKEKLVKLKERHPSALILAHPECESHILEMADYIASTTGLLNFTKSSKAQTFIVATESGILHQMQKASPEKSFIAAPPNNNCACNECPHMRLNTLEKLYLALKYELPEILLPDETIIKGRVCIDRMLEISAQAGL